MQIIVHYSNVVYGQKDSLLHNSGLDTCHELFKTD